MTIDLNAQDREPIYALIDEVIEEINSDYCASSDSQYRFLSEGDIQGELYAQFRNKLYNHLNSWRQHSVWLHSQVAMKFESSQLGKYRPDLSLCFQAGMDRANYWYPPESFIAHIEIKYVKDNSKDTRRSIVKDWIKLHLLLHESKSLIKSEDQLDSFVDQLVKGDIATRDDVIQQLKQDAQLITPHARGYVLCFSRPGGRPGTFYCRDVMQSLERIDYPSINVHFCPAGLPTHAKPQRQATLF